MRLVQSRYLRSDWCDFPIDRGTDVATLQLCGNPLEACASSLDAIMTQEARESQACDSSARRMVACGMLTRQMISRQMVARQLLTRRTVACGMLGQQILMRQILARQMRTRQILARRLRPRRSSRRSARRTGLQCTRGLGCVETCRWDEEPFCAMAFDSPMVVVEQHVVMSAQQDTVVDVSAAVIVIPFVDVVGFAPGRRSVAGGEDAPAVSHAQCGALASGEASFGSPVVEGSSTVEDTLVEQDRDQA